MHRHVKKVFHSFIFLAGCGKGQPNRSCGCGVYMWRQIPGEQGSKWVREFTREWKREWVQWVVWVREWVSEWVSERASERARDQGSEWIGWCPFGLVVEWLVVSLSKQANKGNVQRGYGLFIALHSKCHSNNGKLRKTIGPSRLKFHSDRE